MKTERLVAILSILANVDRITAKELADRFEVSKMQGILWHSMDT